MVTVLELWTADLDGAGCISRINLRALLPLDARTEELSNSFGFEKQETIQIFLSTCRNQYI